jgi:Flp pilus assembly protein TadG
MILTPSFPDGLVRLLRAERGVALIEFAYSLPIVLVIGFGGLETANLALANLKVNQIAETVADNAGRVTSGIDESDINEVFAGALQIGQSINFQANGRIVLSSLQDNGLTGTKKGQMINWQRCTGALTSVAPSYGTQGKGKTDASLQYMGPSTRQIASLPNTAVMFVEVTYNYTSLIPGYPARTIRYESAFNVRERTNQNITNTQSLTLNSC